MEAEGTETDGASRSEASAPGDAPPGDAQGTVELDDRAWKDRLTRERFDVLRKGATEPAWSGELLHVHEDGIFTCAGCGAELFTSNDKFDSGSGWPSFTRAMRAGTIEEHVDHGFGMRRTEIRCARCHGHLGHVFPDGPAPTGLRYCVNSLSLDFVPPADDRARDRQGSPAHKAPLE